MSLTGRLSRYDKTQNYVGHQYLTKDATGSSRIAQSSEQNEVQDYADFRAELLASDLVANCIRSGGYDFNNPISAGLVTLVNTDIFTDKHVLYMAGGTITIPASESVRLGVRYNLSDIDSDADSGLLGQSPVGTQGQGKRGAGRFKLDAVWGYDATDSGMTPSEFSYRGLWADATVYAADDIVQDSTGAYFKTAGGGTSSGDDSGLAGGSDTGVAWTAYVGTDGNTPFTYQDMGAWASGTVYVANDVVQDGQGQWWKTLAGGTSVGNDSDLGNGSDTGVTWFRFYANFIPLVFFYDRNFIGQYQIKGNNHAAIDSNYDQMTLFGGFIYNLDMDAPFETFLNSDEFFFNGFNYFGAENTIGNATTTNKLTITRSDAAYRFNNLDDNDKEVDQAYLTFFVEKNESNSNFFEIKKIVVKGRRY